MFNKAASDLNNKGNNKSKEVQLIFSQENIKTHLNLLTPSCHIQPEDKVPEDFFPRNNRGEGRND